MMAANPETRQVSQQEMQAASIQVSISSYVATATLGALAGAIALFTYLSQAYDLTTGFYWWISAAGVAFVISLVIGGKGSSEVAKLLVTGTWTAESKVPKFSLQAFLSLAGLVLLVIATVVALSSPRHESSLETRIHHLEASFAKTGTPGKTRNRTEQRTGSPPKQLRP